MISIQFLKDYLQKCKDGHQDINSTVLVVDDSQLVKRIGDKTLADNQILLGVIPEYDNSRTDNIDNIRDNNYLGLMILEKVNYNDLTEEEENDVFARTQVTVEWLKRKIINDMDSSEDGFCPEFQFLQLSSIKISPVWKFAECNGWLLTATIEK